MRSNKIKKTRSLSGEIEQNGVKHMSNLKLKIIPMVAFALFATQAYASDVYIVQAGSSSTIDITQTGNGNTVGNSTTATTLTGDSQDIDISQQGNSNKTDISTAAGSSSTTINILNTGDSNETVMGIATTGTTFTSTVTGDSNLVTVCGTNDNSGVASVGSTTGGVSTASTSGTIAACTTEVSASDTTTTLATTGDYNTVNLELDAVNAVNTITVGGNVSSNFNEINLTQSTTDIPVVTMTVDGDSNAINIIQN